MSIRALLAIGVILIPVVAEAQSSGSGLADLVTDLILRDGIRLPGTDTGGNPGNPHAGHFTLLNPTLGSQPTSIANESAIRAVLAFNDRLTSQLSNQPLGSSTGGFTFSFDEGSGTYTRGSTSFGPSFSERSRTVGRRKFSVGVTYQHSSFDTFGDVSLTDGSMTFFLPHTDCCGGSAPPPPSPLAPGLEGDVMQAALTLKAKTDTFALLANYGVNDKFDVGLVLPIVRVDLDATVNATIIRLSTSTAPTVHTFVPGQDRPQETFERSGSASGIGDIVVRSKYNIFQDGETGFAAGVDLRLPTGDETDLLGLGAFQSKIYGIVSAGTDRIGSHVNFGFTISERGDVDAAVAGFAPLGASDEFNYSGGVELVAHPRVTVIGDILGRTLMDAGSVEAAAQTFQFRTPAGADPTVALQTSSTNPLTGQPYSQLALTVGENLNLVLGAVGAKVNVAPNLLISGNVLFPITKGGLRDRFTVAFGLDYAF
jgi:hypothetical protein